MKFGLSPSYKIEDQVIQFLTSLNDQFFVVKAPMLLVDPLHSNNKVYSLVIREESNNASLYSMSNVEDRDILVNASYTRKP